MGKIENVVFDLGRVLLEFQPQDYLETLFGQEDLVQQLLKAVFGSPEWFMLDRGVISQKEAVQRLVNQNPTLGDAITLVFADWFSILTPIDSTVEVLHSLKQRGYRLYVISNFHAEAFDYVYQTYDWFKLFDGLIISCHIQALKPEPAIYEALLSKYNLIPEHCLFIDDVLANIEGARQLGIKGIHYQTAEDFGLELDLLLNKGATNNV